ncbi:MAG: transcriptional regulator [Flavobacteriales bacterium]|jgi:DNA-binding transcriptional ArsR family regulator|nr:transcriptional regulator [Flavobacteriales bacterium]
MINKENKIKQTASLLKAIGHPIRVDIILCLSQNRNMTVTELCVNLDIHQPILSLHLGVLRNQNVIKVKKEGKKSIYSISDISIKQIISIIYHTRTLS